MAGFELTGKTAIVTGAGSGVGRELAVAFARVGADTVCVGRREEALRNTCEQIAEAGGSGVPVVADVTEQPQVEEMVARVLEHFGRIDLLFNNAGRFRSVAAVWESDAYEWWEDVRTNLLSTYLCTRAVLPGLIAQDLGIVINMTGGGGADGTNLGGSAYGASKAAIVRFTESLAHELQARESQVLTFCMDPGFVVTPMTRHLADASGEDGWQAFVSDWIEDGIGKPADACAHATLNLLRICTPQLSGRSFDVDTDFEQVARNLDRVESEGLFVMRRRLP